MAKDFGASYDEMDRVAEKLKTGKTEIEGELKTLKDSVDQLLGEDFKTQHASGKFGQNYEELHTGINKAIEGIDGMGEALKGMMEAIQNLDTEMGK